MITRLLVLTLMLCCNYHQVVAAGSLLWEETVVALSPKSTDSAAIAEFNFQNIGKDALVIKEIRPDCSCVTAPLDKMRYEPGEGGRITASFAIGRQTGDHTVTIQVQGNAGDQALSSVLVLHIKIVDVVVFSPRFLYWKADEPLVPKHVTLTLLPSELITLREVRAGNPAFRVQLSPTADPRRFTLLVTPPATYTRSICPIIVITESSDHAKAHEHSMVARLL